MNLLSSFFSPRVAATWLGISLAAYWIVKVAQAFLHGIPGWDDPSWQAELDEDDKV